MNSYIEKEALSRLCTINGSDRGFYKHAEQDIIQMPPIILSVLTFIFITINLKTHKTYLYSRLIIFYVLAFVKCFDHFLTKEPDIALSVECPVFVVKKPVSENQNFCLTFGDRIALDYL